MQKGWDSEMTKIKEEAKLSDALLEKELAELVKKKIITEKIAGKILDKLEEKKIQLSKDELAGLVHTIQKISTKGVKKIPDTSGELSSVKNRNKERDDEKMQAFETLKKEVDRIDDKLQSFEENQRQFQNYSIPSSAPIFSENATKKNGWCECKELHPLHEISNDPETIIVFMRWLQYLIDKIGQEQLPEVLDYYVNIDWITEDFRLEMIKYAKGIRNEADQKTQKTAPSGFTLSDHLQSLIFIQKLKGTTLQDDFLIKLTDKLDKMEKTIATKVSV